jgi:hypothetical protein
MLTGFTQVHHRLRGLFPLTQNDPLARLFNSIMSDIRSPGPTSSPSNFEAIFIASIEKYSKQTKQDLRKHPLASKIGACKSAEEILDIFRDQAKEFSDFRNGDPKLIKCLEPIIGCLYAVSTSPVLGTALSLVSCRDLVCFLIAFPNAVVV